MLPRALTFVILAKLVFCRYFIVGPAQMRIESIVPCSNYSDLPLKFVSKPHMFNKSTQVFDVFITIPGEINNNITVFLKASRVDKHKVQLNSFVINNGAACPTLNKYVGDLWYDIQSQVGMEPGVCPIKAGNYSMKNVVLDLSKLKVQMLLEGHFQTRIVLKNGTKTIYCDDYNIILSPKDQ